MSAEDLSATSNAELISQFIRGALRVGGGYRIEGILIPGSAEAMEVVNRLRAIAVELRTRRPLSEVRPLFSHDDPDVRSWASGQLGSLDPEWASAGVAGIGENLNAAQVMELRRRARTRSPKTPPLHALSNVELVARFEDAAMRRYAATFIRDRLGMVDVELRNRIVGETGEIGEELTRRKILDALLPQLDHPLLMVRYIAANWCLPIVPERAIPILEEVAKPPFRYMLEGMHAANKLEEWRKAH